MHDDIKPAGGQVHGPLERKRFLALLWRSAVAQAIFVYILLAYCAFLVGLFVLFPDLLAKFAPSDLLIVMLTMALANFLLLIPHKFVEMAIYERPERPTLALCRNLLSVMGNREILARGLPIYFVLAVFMLVFANVKTSITVINPFAWDKTFAQWDLVLHFGRSPWQWIHPILGYPPVTFLINFNYILWNFILFGFLMHFGLLTRLGEERTRYFLCFLLSWIVGGSLFALLLSSAGPCYYGEGGLGIDPDPYAGLMAYLKAANQSFPLSALSVQATLWNTVGQPMPFGGVSAMPSMHNATALLFVLASRKFPRWLRWLLIVHLVLVYLGSIHLAWHYAVDAYLAWAITLAAWRVAGPLSRWWESRPGAQALSHALDLRQQA